MILRVARTKRLRIVSIEQHRSDDPPKKKSSIRPAMNGPPGVEDLVAGVEVVTSRQMVRAW